MGRFPIDVRAALGLGLAFFVSSAAAPPRASDSPLGLYDGPANVEFRYYDVSGKTVAQIRSSGMRLSPRDPVSGKPFAGLTQWHLEWDAPDGPDGRCRLDRAEVTLDVIITLPRLTATGGVPPTVLRRWSRFITALKAHEATHARIAHEGREAMLRAIQRADCATAPAAAAAAAAALDRWSAAYDEATEHGLTEGVHFP
jgi:predicted secreted Zn-dependent protease